MTASMVCDESSVMIPNPLVSSKALPGRRPASAQGFTLLEIVIVLTLLAIVVAASVPSLQGLRDEQTAREPITALAVLAKQTRLRAIQEKRPYQIAFTEQGFTATRYISPYLQAVQLEEFIQQAAMQAEATSIAQLTPDSTAPESTFSANGQTTNSTPAVFKEWTERYSLPAGTQYSVQFWHESVPTPVAGSLVKLWVFQPSGMVSPLTVRLNRENASFEASFNSLTADIVSEKSDLH